MHGRLESLQQDFTTLGTAHSELEALNNKWAQNNVDLTKQNEEMKVSFIGSTINRSHCSPQFFLSSVLFFKKAHF